ncbi:MAG: Anthranilate 1,2-dioxygenase electron transfer component [candidate division WS6 bacterium OLB20]|uniref:Anthranilate 1,2-dioxygenase electron transfer component n=1 Tax=candidate division WS6 bacterium OLB20 TaxID=1617426 RepID=A0A136LW03_9BACT|nr:MAG: Anthranilate 1,2-dioxygenase electron transfer component [candidate division WS6 bacterium OLB20]
MAVKNYQATISEVEKAAHATYRVRFALPEGETIEFQPGQFMTIKVSDSARRSYSIASAPENNTYLETFADTVAGGPGSQFFAHAEVGGKAEFLAPLGRFVYRSTDRPAYFFATGTGLTPFLSMVRFALDTEKTTRKLHLLFGLRHEGDIFAEDILKAYAEKYSNFSYEICLSRPDAGWTGFTGRVTARIPDIAETDIDLYICGSQKMINDVESAFLAKGVPEAQIYYEQFY